MKSKVRREGGREGGVDFRMWRAIRRCGRFFFLKLTLYVECQFFFGFGMAV